MNSLILASDKDIRLVAQTAARDLTPIELDHFVHMSRTWGLDPLRRQIYAIVYNKNKPDKRRVTYITGIDGYRTIADRTGCYKPGPRTTERDPSAKNPATNPKGIILGRATVFKHAQGEWHEFTEEVEWDEFAPVEQEWAAGEDGKRRPTNVYKLTEMWMRMGVNQIKKCAEAQCLRRGWPDTFSGLYVDAEMDRATLNDMIDITPHEQAQRADRDERQARLGGPSILFDFCDGEPLQAVPVGKTHDRIMQFIEEHKDDNPEKIALFTGRNRMAINQYWSHDAGAALDVKRHLEKFKAEDAA